MALWKEGEHEEEGVFLPAELINMKLVSTGCLR